MRVAAVVQAALLGLMAAVVLSRARLALPGWSKAATWLSWAVVAFTGVILVLNAITPSAGERQVWVPVVLVLLASSLTVALTARRLGAWESIPNIPFPGSRATIGRDDSAERYCMLWQQAEVSNHRHGMCSASHQGKGLRG